MAGSEVVGQQVAGVKRLRVLETVDETSEAVSFVVANADEDDGRLDYQPGQFLTLRLPVDPLAPIARCYSLSSSPTSDLHARFTVKRVADGIGSNWLCDKVRPGDILESLPAAGRFVPEDLDRDLLLFAAGSGVTPVHAILRSALAEGSGRVLLFYANRDMSSVIFAEELQRLQALHGARLQVRHWLETLDGLPTISALREVVRDHPRRDMFVCGPAPFMEAARLAAAGLDVGDLLVEEYVSLAADPFTVPEVDASEAGAELVVHLDGTRHELRWPEGSSMLDVMLAGGIQAPFSCRESSCGACAAVTLCGEVRMAANEVLEDEDLSEGIILTCQAEAVTDMVEISFDV